MESKIANFEELEEHVKSSELNYREAVIDYYRTLGERLGFESRPNASVIKHGVSLGAFELVWVEPNIVFCCEFGGFEEILKHLWRIREYNPEKAVLLLSSGSTCRPDHVKRLIASTPLLEGMTEKLIILDLKEKKVVHPH